MDELFMEQMSTFTNNRTLYYFYRPDRSFELFAPFTFQASILFTNDIGRPSSVTSDGSKPMRPITAEQLRCREARQIKLSEKAWAAKQQEKRDRDSKASREYRAKKKHEFQVNKLRVSQLRH